MLDAIKKEITTTWVGGSKFDRLMLVAFSLFFPYYIIRGNWFDAIVAILVLVWVWQSVKEETING